MPVVLGFEMSWEERRKVMKEWRETSSAARLAKGSRYRAARSAGCQESQRAVDIKKQHDITTDEQASCAGEP